MTDRIKELAPSLAGTSLEYKLRGSSEDVRDYLHDEQILRTRELIDKEVSLARSCKSSLNLIFLGEMYFYYRSTRYYSAVRDNIKINRLRIKVHTYLSTTSVEDRGSILVGYLKKYKTGKERDVVLSAVKYFVGIYRSRLGEFRDLLTREELLLIA